MTNNDELAHKVKTYAVNCNDAWLNSEGDDISDSYVKYKDYAALLAEREADKSLINKIKSTCCTVDMRDGSVIPSSLDAWGRPVPQYLPYDFSGNPGASATQYCNGWNDAGGYWLNYVSELRQRIAELEALTADQDKRLLSYAAIATKNAEARTLSVSAADIINVAEGKNHAPGRMIPIDTLGDYCAAAGIKLEVGE